MTPPTPSMLREETLAELQVRLLLQRKCAGLARSIAGVPCPCVLRLGLVLLVDIGFTLLVYDRDDIVAMFREALMPEWEALAKL